MRCTRSRVPWVGRVWSAPLLVALITVLLMSDRDAAAQQKSKKKTNRSVDVASCVTCRQDDADDGVDFHLDSNCEVALDCSVTWTLRCQTREGKKGKKAHDGVAFALEPNASHLASASPQSCGEDGWIIDDVIWSCR